MKIRNHKILTCSKFQIFKQASYQKGADKKLKCNNHAMCEGLLCLWLADNRHVIGHGFLNVLVVPDFTVVLL